MPKCYYCKDEVTNDDLTEVKGDWIRVCADCRDFAEKHGWNILESWLFGEGDVKEFKEFYRIGDKFKKQC